MKALKIILGQSVTVLLIVLDIVGGDGVFDCNDVCGAMLLKMKILMFVVIKIN